MKKKLVFIALLLCTLPVSAQVRIYSTTGLEFPFAFADLDVLTHKKGNTLMFSVCPNINEHINFDFGNSFGVYTGLSFRNLGFNYKSTKSDIPLSEFEDFYGINSNFVKKFRTLSLGIPVGLKLGNFQKFFFYGGYELGIPLHYKEITIIDNSKNKTKEWFSDKVSPLTHSFFFGVEFPYSVNVKFNWNFTKFFDNNCTLPVEQLTIPYNLFHANIFYISLNISILENFQFYYKRYIEKSDEYYY
ncbi:MAG: hypothetical protein ACOX4D_09005 [Bacteroidales bacterium]